ncbi:MAG TPA: hypothetical protein ENN25_06240, partial [Euryarchaeota archaeon]|nr:hypothetical protein [Euryarchaeota archaeon]
MDQERPVNSCGGFELTKRKYYFSTKDLAIIALLSALGGALSTYVGYLGNLVNHVIGVPFGAGQFLAGLHIIWIMLVLGITKKKGTGILAGFLKGTIELFLGGTHGVVIVIVSSVQGLLADVFLFSDRAKEQRSFVRYSVAGGISAASNVVIFQIFFFAGVPVLLIVMLSMLAFASGIIFGGLLTIQLLESLEGSGVVPSRNGIIVDQPKGDYDRTQGAHALRRRRIAVISSVMFLGLFTIGGAYYFTSVYSLPGNDTVEIYGHVENSYDFYYGDLSEHEVTINAELIGSVTYVSPRNYTGIPLSIVVGVANPLDGSESVVVSANDGYSAVFQLSDIINDDQ